MAEAEKPVEPPQSWVRRCFAFVVTWVATQLKRHPRVFIAGILGVAAISAIAAQIASHFLYPAERQARIFPLEINSPFVGKPNSLDADSSGRFLVTTSTSPTATVWFRETEDSWRPTIFRAPRRDEFAPAKYLAAIAPDASYVALSAPPTANDEGGYKHGSARIYLFDRPRHELTATLEINIPTYVTRLRFSPDGKYLAALLSGGCGLRIWSVSQWSTPAGDLAPVFQDDEGYAGSATASGCCPQGDSRSCEALPRGTDIVFSDEGTGQYWIFAVSTAGLKMYSRPKPGQGKALALGKPNLIPAEEIKLKQPGRLAVAPDLSRIAIGDVGFPQLVVLKRAAIGYEYERSLSVPNALLTDQAAAAKNELFLPNPSWFAEGNKLGLLGYGFIPNQALKGKRSDDETNNIVIFDPEDPDHAKFQEVPGEVDSFLYISQLFEPGASTKTAYISTEHLAVIDPAAVQRRAPTLVANIHAASFRGFDEDFRLIVDKRNNLYFSTILDGKYALFSILLEKLRLADVEPFKSETDLKERLSALIRTTEYDDSFSLSNDEASRAEWGYDERVADAPPKFFGRPVPVVNVDPDEVSRSAVKVPKLPGLSEPRMVVWGTDRAIRIVSDGAGIVCTRPIRDEAQRMNITADGQFLVVAHGDGVIRWYGLGFSPSNCLPLVMSLYVTRNDGEGWGFLAWLPDGRYAIYGAVGSHQLACYPVELPGRPPACVDFQQGPSFYEPDAVRNALRDAPRLRGPRPNAANTDRAAAFAQGVGLIRSALAQEAVERSIAGLARAESAHLAQAVRSSILNRAERPSIAIDVVAPLTVAEENLVAEVTVSGWDDGKPRYLSFKANERDVPLIYNGVRYGEGQVLPVNSRAKMQLTLVLPKVVQMSGQFQLCEFLYRGVSEGGTPDKTTTEDLTNKNPCVSMKWAGREQGVKRKLWVILMGFSKSQASPLQYAHEDALDFARFLASDFKKRLQSTVGGVSAFDDIRIELFIAPPATTTQAQL